MIRQRRASILFYYNCTREVDAIKKLTGVHIDVPLEEIHLCGAPSGELCSCIIGKTEQGAISLLDEVIGRKPDVQIQTFAVDIQNFFFVQYSKVIGWFESITLFEKS